MQDTDTDKVLILASKDNNGKYVATSILDNSDPYSNLEYGDVREQEYQVWVYPSGAIYTMEADREVSQHDYYSTPYASSGVKWLPKLTIISKDEQIVSESY